MKLKPGFRSSASPVTEVPAGPQRATSALRGACEKDPGPRVWWWEARAEEQVASSLQLSEYKSGEPAVFTVFPDTPSRMAAVGDASATLRWGPGHGSLQQSAR